MRKYNGYGTEQIIVNPVEYFGIKNDTPSKNQQEQPMTDQRGGHVTLNNGTGETLATPLVMQSVILNGPLQVIIPLQVTPFWKTCPLQFSNLNNLIPTSA